MRLNFIFDRFKAKYSNLESHPASGSMESLQLAQAVGEQDAGSRVTGYASFVSYDENENGRTERRWNRFRLLSSRLKIFKAKSFQQQQI
jgi:hypothetical protein